MLVSLIIVHSMPARCEESTDAKFTEKGLHILPVISYKGVKVFRRCRPSIERILNTRTMSKTYSREQRRTHKSLLGMREHIA